MRTILLALGLFIQSGPPTVAAVQEGEPSVRRSREEPLERVRLDYFRMKTQEDRSPDLWYGTPGVRAGGDLLGPIWELVRRPSGLLDFRPGKVDRWLPDRETAEFLRERR